jgi:hypothetical protein
MTLEMMPHATDYRQWHEFRLPTAIGQQPVDQLGSSLLPKLRNSLFRKFSPSPGATRRLLSSSRRRHTACPRLSCRTPIRHPLPHVLWIAGRARNDNPRFMDPMKFKRLKQVARNDAKTLHP